ncbi:hypothetical protein SELMODRAFT_414812 [Selaginella moellendorffii]|uniref:SAP domain-containing protein n=1 Tax=Selaginella moellendorffii TaxID=88036 RepID=D8RUQ2_SELML|nr:hypothetical protein SELMODRAFT_414812 [Selaginella moellendorffii]
MWQFLKDTDLDAFYMPLRDLCELLLAAPLAGHGDCSEAEDRERYHKFGGSVRSVLVHHRKTNYNSRFDRALQTAKKKAQIEYMIGNVLQGNDIEYIRQNQGISDETVLVGKRFEHQLRCSKPRLQARRLHRPISTETCEMLQRLLRRMNLPESGRKTALIQRLRDANFKGVYDMEEGPVIEDEQEKMEDDAEGEVEPEDQVTVNDRHHAQAKYIDELINRYNLKRFYFVVP